MRLWTTGRQASLLLVQRGSWLGRVKRLAADGYTCFCQHRSDNPGLAAKNVFEIKSRIDSDVAVSGMFEQIKGVCATHRIAVPSILINTAAVFEKIPLADVNYQNAFDMMAVNAIAPLVIAKHFAGMFGSSANARPGKIINFADVCASSPWADYSAYCASKAALVAITKSLAKELAPNITVNAIAPGIIGDDIASDPEKQKQLSKIPLKRFGDVRDIVSTVKFIIDNDYITGQVINIDGGRTI
jgi:NAD(P)-dependent dehydrogenase (short-subunit alcohol dehydrogenase family)